MNSSNRMKKRWGYDRYSRTLIREKQALAPHWFKFCTEEGLDALNVFQLQAHLVILGTEPKSRLLVTRKMISESLDIPEHVFDAIFDSISAFLDLLNYGDTEGANETLH